MCPGLILRSETRLLPDSRFTLTNYRFRGVLDCSYITLRTGGGGERVPINIYNTRTIITKKSRRKKQNENNLSIRNYTKAIASGLIMPAEWI